MLARAESGCATLGADPLRRDAWHPAATHSGVPAVARG